MITMMSLVNALGKVCKGLVLVAAQQRRVKVRSVEKGIYRVGSSEMLKLNAENS